MYILFNTYNYNEFLQQKSILISRHTSKTQGIRANTLQLTMFMIMSTKKAMASNQPTIEKKRYADRVESKSYGRYGP